jgi:tetratricopeptide (TPR) repeat protein
MQDSPSVLTKKAIDASLKGNWKEAIQYNNLLLLKTPKDIDAKIRLGRAYIQIKEFNKAKKVFKEVLLTDPINSVAQKNLKLAQEGKTERNSGPIDPKSLIKEPGITAEITLDIDAKRITSESFSPAEPLEIKVFKHKADFYKTNSHGELMYIATVSSEIVNRMRIAKEKGAELNAFFSGRTNGDEKRINVLLRTSIPVFKGERQEVKPYIKPGSLDEPEMEIPSEYEE